jgi:hypothetical protein
LLQRQAIDETTINAMAVDVKEIEETTIDETVIPEQEPG